MDPSVQNGTVTVDVTMTERLPKGARPDLSIGRPAFGQEQSAAGLFKMHADGTATRVQVKPATYRSQPGSAAVSRDHRRRTDVGVSCILTQERSSSRVRLRVPILHRLGAI